MVGKTVFNPRSSRSHAVVMLHICWSQEAVGWLAGLACSFWPGWQPVATPARLQS